MQYSNILAPHAADVIMIVIDPDTANNVDLQDIKVLTKIGETVGETKIVPFMPWFDYIVSLIKTPLTDENFF